MADQEGGERMARLIDADALKNSLDEHVYLVTHGFNETEYGCTQYGIHQIIDEAPTIEAEPVRHGKWIFNPIDALEAMFTNPKCSVCGFESADGGNYCPNCGARMDKE